MAEIQHSQIKTKLMEGVIPHINVADVQGDEQSREQHALSRSISAIALMIAAGVDVTTATGAIVDGYGDNGLDLIYFDPATKALYLVQAKWSKNHGSSIDSGDVLKFLRGVQDLVSLKKERFNSKVQERWTAIEDALKRLSSVHLLIAYPGFGQLGTDIRSKIDDFVSSQNDTSDLFFFDLVTQKDLFAHFVRALAPPRIDLTIKLAHFGLVEAPLKAVYGQVSVADVLSWYQQYGNNLFSGNIRHFLGMKSEVNTAISRTLVSSPDNFWYFNNGLTLLAEGFSKQAFGGNDRSVGLFDCRGVTVVNGAQTVGAIGRTSSSSQTSAVLQARIILVPDPESTVGKDITRASNTQNRIDARNFVALDPEQERIRTELLVTGVDYEFREGESVESPAEGFEFIEAITSLACAGDDISYVALAKGYVGGLYADINNAPYKVLFNSGTSSARLWEAVKQARSIDRVTKALQPTSDAAQRGILVHGNRFITHFVLRRMKTTAQARPDVMPDVTHLVKDTVQRLQTILASEFPDAYLAPLFKNVGKCGTLRTKLEG